MNIFEFQFPMIMCCGSKNLLALVCVSLNFDTSEVLALMVLIAYSLLGSLLELLPKLESWRAEGSSIFWNLLPRAAFTVMLVAWIGLFFNLIYDLFLPNFFGLSGSVSMFSGKSRCSVVGSL